MSISNTNLVMFVLMLWIIGAIIGGICTEAYLASTTGGTTVASSIDILTHPMQYPTKWFGAVFGLVTFDLPFFTGGWVIFKWLLLTPLTVGFFFGLFGAVGTKYALVLLGIFSLSSILSWIF